MGFGTPPTVITCDADIYPCLEGDYSEWTQKWISDALTNTYNIEAGAINIDGERIFFWGNEKRYFVILNLSNGAIVSEEDIFTYGGRIQTFNHSLLGKYEVSIGSETKIRVYKDGSLQQTIEISGIDCYGVLMSYNGRYIIIIDANSGKVYCYEGS